MLAVDEEIKNQSLRLAPDNCLVRLLFRHSY